MKYYIKTFGCQMNKSDSERIAAVLENCGYLPTTKEKEADLIIINVCSVRQSAVDRVYGFLNQKLKIKNQNDKSKSKIILTGCILPKDKERLKNKVDLIFDINQLLNLPRILSSIETDSKNKQFKNLKLKIKNYLDVIPKYSTFPIAYVPIMTGCNNFCSYCVVPYTRGKEVSRPVEEIICEVKELIKRGYKMIILLGQNVNSYQQKIKNQKSKIKNTERKLKNEKNLRIINFPKLLKIINDLEGNFWFSFITSHPKDFSNELIKTMAKCEKLMPYLHLPVQSGDDQILKKMNRHYTVAYYKKLIRLIRTKFVKICELPICLSTDIIVGFPGETKKQFENTVKLMKEIKFDMAYIAKYSPRPGTAAEKLKDDVSQKEKERRWKILTKILEKIALENNKKYINKTVDGLVTEKKNNQLFALTKTFKKVKILTSCQSTQIWPPILQRGDFVKIKIIKAIPWGLEGKIL